MHPLFPTGRGCIYLFERSLGKISCFQAEILLEIRNRLLFVGDYYQS